MRKTVLLLGLAVMSAGLMAVTSQYKASQIVFTDADTLQGKQDAGSLSGSISSADCSGVTTGVDGMLCQETADDSLWRCTTTTCNAAGWEQVGGGSGDVTNPVNATLTINDDITAVDQVLFSDPAAGAALIATVNPWPNNSGNTALWETDVPYGDPTSDPVDGTVLMKFFRLNTAGLTGGWDAIDPVFDIYQYNWPGVSGSGCTVGTVHCIKDTRELNYDEPGGATGLWESHLSLTRAGETDFPRYRNHRIGLANGNASWVWSTADDETDADTGTKGIMKWGTKTATWTPALQLSAENLLTDPTGAIQIGTDISVPGFTQNRVISMEPRISESGVGQFTLLNGGANLANLTEAFVASTFYGISILPNLSPSFTTGNSITEFRGISMGPTFGDGTQPITVSNVSGLFIQPDFGDNTTTGTYYGLQLRGPLAGTSLKPTSSIFGLRIFDHGWPDGTVASANQVAFKMDTQTPGGSNQGRHGNFWIEGMNWDSGHMMFSGSTAVNADHIWWDQTNEMLRWKADSAPTSEINGSGGGGETNGVVPLIGIEVTNSAPSSTCAAIQDNGRIVLKSANNAAAALYLCSQTNDGNSFEWRRLATGEAFVVGDSGGDATETTLSLNNYDPMNLSLAETFDRTTEFTVNADTICYTGANTFQARITAAISFDRTAGAGTDVVTMAFGKEQSATLPMDDGNEFGEEYQRSIDAAGVGMGQLAATTSLDTDDCIGIMAQTNNITGGSGWTMEAVSLHIEDP